MLLVQYLQIFSGICWLIVVVSMSGSGWRLLFGQTNPYDEVRGAFLFMGVLQSGFVVRWLLFPAAIEAMEPAELNLWTALYALCGLLALWVLLVARAYGRGRS